MIRRDFFYVFAGAPHGERRGYACMGRAVHIVERVADKEDVVSRGACQLHISEERIGGRFRILYIVRADDGIKILAQRQRVEDKTQFFAASRGDDAESPPGSYQMIEQLCHSVEDMEQIHIFLFIFNPQSERRLRIFYTEPVQCDEGGTGEGKFQIAGRISKPVSFSQRVSQRDEEIFSSVDKRAVYIKNNMCIFHKNILSAAISGSTRSVDKYDRSIITDFVYAENRQITLDIKRNSCYITNRTKGGWSKWQ